MSWWETKARNDRAERLVALYGRMPTDQELVDLRKHYEAKIAKRRAETLVRLTQPGNTIAEE